MSIFSFIARLFRDPTRISARDFMERRGPSDPVLDVRTPREYAGGHLAGAVNVDVRAPDFAERVDGLIEGGTLDRASSVYLYCRSGARSGQAARILRDRGFEAAFNVGGIGGLEAAGAAIRR